MVSMQCQLSVDHYFDHGYLGILLTHNTKMSLKCYMKAYDFIYKFHRHCAVVSLSPVDEVVGITSIFDCHDHRT